MNFLAPLFALGFLAVAAPILFHLIRRRPKGEVPFSSVMFLTPSPPPPASRRRLDQLLLLLLRAAALVFLGLAFMRPFFRQDAAADAGGSGRRVVVLIDTSASMKRGELWKQAVAKADDALAECRPADRVAVYAFDRTVRPVLSFAESDQLEPQQKIAVARDRVKQLTPSWGATALDRALIESTAAILEAGENPSGKVVLVSDLQQGASLTELTGFEWPAEVELDLRAVADARGNAGLTLLTERAEAEKGSGPDQVRVRVTNDTASTQERFKLAWAGTTGSEIEAYVPPGESRVLKVPRPATGASTLRLLGDPHEFDNTAYLAGPRRREMTVHFVGTDTATDANGLLYFLERAWDETPERLVRVVARKPDDPLTADEVRAAPLVVLAGPPSSDTTRVLEKYLTDGGTVLCVLGSATALPALAGATPRPVQEAKVEQYTMLRDIAFDHPLFAPLAGPQFSDFTKIHVWKHRKLTDDHLPRAKVLVWFDDGDPAVLEKASGRGRLVVWASSWRPADSQLARSSKFVPLMAALLELRHGRIPTATVHRIGERVPVPANAAAMRVRKPDGTTVSLAADATTFDGTDQPGEYALETPAGVRPIAVNLDPAESLTTPIPAETLEQFGCRLVKRGAEPRSTDADRQQQNAELERSQSLWRVLILVAIAAVLVETALSGWRTRSAQREVVRP
jgi:hypothetical protein